MKKHLIVGIAITTVLFSSCEQNSEKIKVDKGKEVLEDISFQLEPIPAVFEVEKIESPENSLEKTFDKQTLGLPLDFTSRDFLTNTVGYKDKLEYLVGMVVKKEKVKGEDTYFVVLDFKNDSSIVKAKIPSQGILLEKKYDKKIGAGIQYLIASAEMDRNSAFQILIADVSEITISDNSINKLALYNTYNNDSEIDKYFVIRAAVTTSILYKSFTKMSSKSEFNAAAIKVASNYYSESSDLKQDWKIGMQLTSVKEFLKGFKPIEQPNL